MTIPHSDLILSLKRSSGSPYSCTIDQTSRFVVSLEGEIGQTDRISKYIYESEESSCELSESSSPRFPTLISFSILKDGLDHTVQKTMTDVEPSWECELWEHGDYPLGVAGFFPQGGWDLFLQAQALLEVFGPTKMEVSGSIVEMSWSSIPNERIVDMGSPAGVLGRDDSALEEVRFAMDFERGLPVSVGFYYRDGESVSSTFEGFVFLEGSYSSAAEKLEAELEVPESFSCTCDYSDPFRIVQLREGAVRK